MSSYRILSILGNPAYVLIRLPSAEAGAEWTKAIKKSIPDWESNVKIAETVGLNVEVPSFSSP